MKIICKIMLLALIIQGTTLAMDEKIEHPEKWESLVEAHEVNLENFGKIGLYLKKCIIQRYQYILGTIKKSSHKAAQVIFEKHPANNIKLAYLLLDEKILHKNEARHWTEVEYFNISTKDGIDFPNQLSEILTGILIKKAKKTRLAQKEKLLFPLVTGGDKHYLERKPKEVDELTPWSYNIYKRVNQEIEKQVKKKERMELTSSSQNLLNLAYQANLLEK